MILALIRQLPMPLIQIVYLVIFSYYTVRFPSIPLIIVDILIIFLVIKHYKKRIIPWLICLSVSTMSLFNYWQWQENKIYNQQPNTISQVRLIPDTVAINGDSLTFTGEHKHNSYKLFYKLKSKRELVFFRENRDYLEIVSEIALEEAEGIRNFSGFDYRAFLKYQGIHRIGHIKELNQLSKSPTRNLIEIVRTWRRQAIIICQKEFPKPMSDYMTGLLFGYLDKSFGEMTRIYSQLGIIHLFALSGMQVAFFLNYFRKLLILLGIPRDYFPYLDILFSLFYAFITGFSISVLRSLWQSNLRNFGFKGLDNIALAFLLMFICDRQFLLSIGGVLSFAYAFFITVLRFESFEGIRRRVYETFALNFCLLPFIISYFSQYNVIAILLTILFSFLFDNVILPILCITFLLSPLIKFSIFNSLFLLMEKLVHLIEGYTSKPITLGNPNVIQFFLLIMALAFFVNQLSKKKTVFLPTCVIVLLFLSMRIPFRNEITVVDVGQGDSILIRDMNNKTLLIDVGGVHHFDGREAWQKKYRQTNADRTLIPYLKSRGITKIDYLLLTHTDNDHVGDMEEVAKNFEVKEILTSQGSMKNVSFVNRIKAMKIKTKLVKAGDRLSIMGSYLQVLYPWSIGDGKNNDSLVLYGRLLGKNFLFTGDIEAEGEKALLSKYPNLKVDILKVGHHGSKGSSTENFLNTISMKVALISAGNNNAFKHPSPETLERFKERHVKVYRTDQQGSIRFTGRRQWEIETCR